MYKIHIMLLFKLWLFLRWNAFMLPMPLSCLHRGSKKEWYHVHSIKGNTHTTHENFKCSKIIHMIYLKLISSSNMFSKVKVLFRKESNKNDNFVPKWHWLMPFGPLVRDSMHLEVNSLRAMSPNLELPLYPIFI